MTRHCCYLVGCGPCYLIDHVYQLVLCVCATTLQYCALSKIGFVNLQEEKEAAESYYLLVRVTTAFQFSLTQSITEPDWKSSMKAKHLLA